MDVKIKTYREEVFIIEWYTLPQEQKDLVHQNLEDRFANGVFIEWPTEFNPYDEDSFNETLTMDRIKKYWKDQCETNNYEGDLEAFIKEYGLEFDVWIIKQNFDLKGIKKILIEVDW